jgi:hypothetical protein
VARKAERHAEVTELLAEGRELVERVERLVCSLYGVADELVDEVVDNAVVRAAASQPADE